MEILKLMKHGTPRQKAMWLSFASIAFGLIFAYLLAVMGVTWIVMDWLGF